MNIAKGIQGIRKIRQENKTGWHVFVNDTYFDYVDQDFKTIVEHRSWMNNTLIGVTGNGLIFSVDR